jgi:hypothetical protein
MGSSHKNILLFTYPSYSTNKMHPEKRNVKSMFWLKENKGRPTGER